MVTSTANNVQLIYSGRVRFQERSNRRYLQQQVIEEVSRNGNVTGSTIFWEDVPMVDENEQPLDKSSRAPSDKMGAVR